jgi:hypothetical protein
MTSRALFKILKIMNCDLIYIIKAFLPTKDLYYFELTCILCYSTIVPTYQKELRILKEWSIRNEYIAFHKSIIKGYLYACRYIVDKFQIDGRAVENYALRKASENGHIDVVKYLVERFQLTVEDAQARSNYAFRHATCNGHLEVLKYLVDTFDLARKDDILADLHYAIYHASRNGRRDIVDYLKSLK